ncbi:MAG: thrombospondin type 3 repeat-containing protein [Archangium sp.]
MRVGWLLGVVFIVGCSTPAASPSPEDVFDPKPNHDFDATTGEVKVVGLDSEVVCFTTDGSEPMEENGECTAGTRYDGAITLTCGESTDADSLATIKVSFSWNGAHDLKATANYGLDCRPPPADRDGDGVVDQNDNCPVTPNADQLDSNGNGIGDACEDAGAPDADCDGRPDTADNCVNVANTNQADDDRDGLGNVCDSDPRGPPALPYMNGTLAKGIPGWLDANRCTLNNCMDPSGVGSWSGPCPGGGTISWNVSLNGLRAISAVTYAACARDVTVEVPDYANDPSTKVMTTFTIIGDGTVTQDTNFSGTGSESGTLTISGAFTGWVSSGVVITNRARSAGSKFNVACSAGPIAGERCAPNNAPISYLFPDWSCAPGACPAPATPLVDSDGDGVFDIFDNCFNVANADQRDVDFDGTGDACDATPGVCSGIPDGGLPPVDAGTEFDAGVPDAGAPPFALLKIKMGRCLYDNGNGGISSAGTCDGSRDDQRWEVIDHGNGKWSYRNHETSNCMTAKNWAGTIGTGACGGGDAMWKHERYDQGGFDMNYPLRLKADAYNYCLYTDGTGLVYATQGNCGLAGTENNRKVGIYANGDFTMSPLQP